MDMYDVADARHEGRLQEKTPVYVSRCKDDAEHNWFYIFLEDCEVVPKG